MKECINKQCSGFDNWIATKSEATYLVHFKEETEQLVYLTADSENEIQEVGRRGRAGNLAGAGGQACQRACKECTTISP